MTIDITEARALVETLKDYAEHPSSFTDISPTEADAAADLIDALMAERDALAREVDACAAALPGPYYMDPPDGGDVPISEQVKRMARDAARIQWLDAPPDAAFHEEIRAIARRTGTPEAIEFAEKLIASGVKNIKRGAA